MLLNIPEILAGGDAHGWTSSEVRGSESVMLGLSLSGHKSSDSCKERGVSGAGVDNHGESACGHRSVALVFF